MSALVPRETVFYLVKAIGEDDRELPEIVAEPDVDKGDVVGKTDAEGQFALNDIPPGNYFLLLWTPYSWRPAELGADDHRPRLIELKPDKQLVLGVVYVAWP